MSGYYDWHQDAMESWKLAIRLMGLRRGTIRPATCFEMYWAEAHGAVP